MLLHFSFPYKRVSKNFDHQASPYVDEKSLIRLLEKLAAHTEFRTLTKGRSDHHLHNVDNYHPHHRHHHRRHRSIDHHTNLEDLLKMKNVYIQAFPTRLWTCESTRAPRTERFSSRGFRSRWISPLQDRRCLWCLIKISSAACHLQWLHPHQHYGHLDHRWRQHQSLATRCSLTGKGSPTSTRHQVITIVTI